MKKQNFVAWNIKVGTDLKRSWFWNNFT